MIYIPPGFFNLVTKMSMGWPEMGEMAWMKLFMHQNGREDWSQIAVKYSKPSLPAEIQGTYLIRGNLHNKEGDKEIEKGWKF